LLEKEHNTEAVKPRVRLVKYNTGIDAACNTLMSLLIVILVFLFVVFIFDMMGMIKLTTMFAFTAPGAKHAVSPAVIVSDSDSTSVTQNLLASPFEGNPVSVD
jgi:hypothetical protein